MYEATLSFFYTAYRLSNFAVILTNQAPRVGSDFTQTATTYHICAYRPGKVGSGATETLMCTNSNQTWRYVVIAKGRGQHLTLCEVQVFGDANSTKNGEGKNV